MERLEGLIAIPLGLSVFCVNDLDFVVGFGGLLLVLLLLLVLGMECRGRGHFPFLCVST